MKFQTIRIEGAILAADILDKIEQADLKGQKPADFGIGDAVKDDIARAWADAQDYWRIYQRKIQSLPERQLGTTETRNLWIVPLLGLLGYKPEFHQKGETVNDKNYALSHRDSSRGGFPIHIMGFKDSLDRKRQDSGPRMSPHGLLQEYLNLTEHLYAIVSNGLQLRLLRDSTRLVKLSYLEFDLEQMMEEGHFSDFAVMYRLLHATRMPVKPEDSAESLIEDYHQESLDSGSRIRDGLSLAVEKCIISFANGFLKHPDNDRLREALESGELDAKTYYQYQLRLIYRLLFLMVIEERDLVYPRNADRSKRDIYYKYYSVSNLRRLAGKRYLADARYRDYWISLKNVFKLFEDEKYGEHLDIRPLAGDLFGYDAIRHLNICNLDNAVVIECLTNLSIFEHPETHQRIRVNYSALNVEEFGAVYEGLLEYDPAVTKANGGISFSLVKGDERSSSGSHYTPDELVTPLIRNSLDHVIAEKLKEKDQEKALLSITVCDVACGSGHILLNAARRIATELAIIRTGEEQPSPESFRQAVRDVIRNCIYGVDINPLAVELCKVAMWLEAHNPNEPLNFLDHHIKCGNAIVGLAHKDELERGIPNEAFKKLDGDDKEVCKAFRDRNKRERKAREGKQMSLGDSAGRDIRKCLEALETVTTMPEKTPKQIVAKQKAYEEWQRSHELRNLRITADMQVAQFFIPKIASEKQHFCTDETYCRHLRGELPLVGQAVAKAMTVGQEKRFFHWFVEFPKVFAHGGFDCILGNPPFLGNRKLKAVYGQAFLTYVCYEYAPAGSVDLVTYFFRRIFSILRCSGFQSLISTNTIAQGGAREGGLAVITDQAGSIIHAVRSMKWPGRAAVEVALITVFKGAWEGKHLLESKNVTHITSYLDDAEQLQDPDPLASNVGRSFQGSIVLGKGFILQPEEAAKLIRQDKRNKDVLFPYLSGEDLNNRHDSSPSRWVINFFDWPLSFEWDARQKAHKGPPYATDYPDCMRIIEELVKPERTRWKVDKTGKEITGQYALRKPLPQKWWIYADKRPALYSTISSFERVLVVAQVAKYPAFFFVPANAVFSMMTIVFGIDTWWEYCCMESAFHSEWIRRYSASLESRQRYTPTDCFDTYPFPNTHSGDTECRLVKAGETYHKSRQCLMQDMQLGLTKTYNLFHSRDLIPEQIAKVSKNPDLDTNSAYTAILALRQNHVEMDNTVLAAYAWDNIDLAHDFYEVDYLPENDNIRYTISPDARREILERLLKLNHERYAEEVAAGLHDKKKTKKSTTKKKVAKVKEAKSPYGQTELEI